LLVKDVYSVVRRFPDFEKFGLTSQICRAAISISANIAEGAGQQSNSQFSRYLGIAYGSASEVLCLIQLAADLEYVDQVTKDKIDTGVEAVQKMLNGLLEKIGGD
jgi:four helix bundle protein